MSRSRLESTVLGRGGALALAFIFAAAAAPSPSLAAQHVADPAHGGVSAICRSVMRLSPGTSDFGACTDSLGATLQQIGAARAIGDARQTCLDAGLRPGDPGLAVCEVKSRHAGIAREPLLQPASVEAGKSYPYMSFRERRRSEQLSCANLGLEPGGSAFGGCVAGLDAALLDADVPAH